MTADLPDAYEDLLALQALDLLEGGALEGKDGAAVNALVRQNEMAKALLADYREVAAALASSVAPVNPPPDLRTRLMDRVRAEARDPQHRKRVTLAPGVTLTMANNIAWKETGIPGIRAKTLFVDPVSRCVRSLVMMEPGAVFPSHRHAQVEELFMVSGELTIDSHAVAPGDYLRADASTLHEAMQTETGCMFIALSCLDDEIVRTP
jgi:putative transcriptional regulator